MTLPRSSFSTPSCFITTLLWISLTLHGLAGTALAVEKISLKKYPHLGIPVSNPVNLKDLPKGKTFQVKLPHVLLQFFFNGQDIFGVIFKRDKRYPIFLRWCFFRNCEESPYDYKSVIADAYSPPFDQNFFSVKFPPLLQYEFQGLDFTTPK